MKDLLYHSKVNWVLNRKTRRRRGGATQIDLNEKIAAIPHPEVALLIQKKYAIYKLLTNDTVMGMFNSLSQINKKLNIYVESIQNRIYTELEAKSTRFPDLILEDSMKELAHSIILYQSIQGNEYDALFIKSKSKNDISTEASSEVKASSDLNIWLPLLKSWIERKIDYINQSTVNMSEYDGTFDYLRDNFIAYKELLDKGKDDKSYSQKDHVKIVMDEYRILLKGGIIDFWLEYFTLNRTKDKIGLWQKEKDALGNELAPGKNHHEEIAAMSLELETAAKRRIEREILKANEPEESYSVETLPPIPGLFSGRMDMSRLKSLTETKGISEETKAFTTISGLKHSQVPKDIEEIMTSSKKSVSKDANELSYSLIKWVFDTIKGIEVVSAASSIIHQETNIHSILMRNFKEKYYIGVLGVLNLFDQFILFSMKKDTLTEKEKGILERTPMLVAAILMSIYRTMDGEVYSFIKPRGWDTQKIGLILIFKDKVHKTKGQEELKTVLSDILEYLEEVKRTDVYKPILE